MASRLSKYITKLINRDQSGFIPIRSAASNVRCLFLNLQLPIDNSGNRAILSLDAAKAFDSIEWDSLWNCLKRFGFGPRYLKWIQLLYSNPNAGVQIKGYISDPFLLNRGTRQGCPLSALLFALAIEPLMEAIRGRTDIAGFRKGYRQRKNSTLRRRCPGVSRGHTYLFVHSYFTYRHLRDIFWI